MIDVITTPCQNCTKETPGARAPAFCYTFHLMDDSCQLCKCSHNNWHLLMPNPRHSIIFRKKYWWSIARDENHHSAKFLNAVLFIEIVVSHQCQHGFVNAKLIQCVKPGFLVLVYMKRVTEMAWLSLTRISGWIARAEGPSSARTEEML